MGENRILRPKEATNIVSGMAIFSNTPGKLLTENKTSDAYSCQVSNKTIILRTILEVHSNCESATSPDKKDTWCSCEIFGYRVSADSTDDFHLYTFCQNNGPGSGGRRVSTV